MIKNPLGYTASKDTKMQITPICLFVYERPEHTQQTLKALLKNKRAEETQLIVFSDAPKHPENAANVQKTRDYVKDILSSNSTFAHVDIIERKENRGLAKSIIEGVDTVIKVAGQAIVVEDDLITSEYFLSYHLDALDYYKNRPEVFVINGYAPPNQTQPIPNDYLLDAYFSPRNMSWGWSTWQDRWEKLDFAVQDYEEFKASLSLQLAFNRLGDDVSQMLYQQQEHGLSSWAIRACYSIFRNHGLTLSPRHSLVDNIGLDGTGQNCTEAEYFRADLSLAKEIINFPDQLYIDERIAEGLRSIFKRPHPGLFGKGAEVYWHSKRSSKDYTRLKLAEIHLETGDLIGAKSLLNEHLNTIPGDPSATTLMGYIAILLGEIDSAKKCFLFALSTYADYLPALEGLTRLNTTNEHPQQHLSTSAQQR